jgi:hypothetical protein
MEAARDLFEEVEIEVPEGMDLPTAIQAASSEEEKSAEEEAAAGSDSGPAAETSQADMRGAAEEQTGAGEASESPLKDTDSTDAGEDSKS